MKSKDKNLYQRQTNIFEIPSIRIRLAAKTSVCNSKPGDGSTLSAHMVLEHGGVKAAGLWNSKTTEIHGLRNMGV